MQFDYRLAGIPCIIVVNSIQFYKGQGRRAASDWDAVDYTEIDFDVCDRRGRLAPWLARKLTDAIVSDITAVAERI